MTVLKNRALAILFGGQLISTIGDNLYGIALLWYVLQLTHSKSALAVTGFATSLPPILGVFVGVWVDRWRKKRTMLVSDLLRTAMLTALFVLTEFAHPVFWWVVAIVVMVEIAGTFFSPAFASLWPRLVKQEQYTSASGLSQSITAFASLGGTLGGGTLMALMSAPVIFLANAISFAISVVSLIFVRIDERAQPSASMQVDGALVDSGQPGGGQVDGSRESSVPDRSREEGQSRRDCAVTALAAEWKAGMSVILKSRYLLQSAATACFNNMSLAGFTVVYTAWVNDVLHRNSLFFGISMAALLVGVMVGGVTASTVARRIGYRTLESLTLIGLGVGVSLTGAWANVWWDMAMLLLAGLMLGLVDGAGGGVSILLVPEEARGRVFSTLGTISRLATPIGIAALGSLMVYEPLWMVLMLTGIGPCLGGISFLMPYSRAMWNEVALKMKR
ncbi:MFS transporter [Alicyclobacillus acidiphilus]|uniref:MFS transporter n=1 Tax=Alicyclobacillus acidiphilus TaxID=182455 RepID=UPI00082E8BA1|nr:MFS transporter [Alicyclobacillus acidiphilus]